MLVGKESKDPRGTSGRDTYTYVYFLYPDMVHVARQSTKIFACDFHFEILRFLRNVFKYSTVK